MPRIFMTPFPSWDVKFLLTAVFCFLSLAIDISLQSMMFRPLLLLIDFDIFKYTILAHHK